MNAEELRERFALIAQERARVLPSAIEFAAAWGNTIALASLQQQYYEYAEACSFTRQQADDALQKAQEDAGGALSVVQKFRTAKDILNAESARRGW